MTRLASVATHLLAAEEAGMRPEDTELSRRYTDILRVRGNVDSTIANYLCAVEGLAQLLGERGLASARRRHRGLPDRKYRVRPERLLRAGGDLGRNS